jgi:hypothetical protein
MKDIVVFRKFKDGQIIALFPELPCDARGNITSYMHIGQHSACSPPIVNETKLATPQDYQGLYNELTSLGYNLEIRKKLR